MGLAERRDKIITTSTHTHWKLGEVLPNNATVVVCYYDENGETGTVLARMEHAFGEYVSWSIDIATGATFRGDYIAGTDLAAALAAAKARHGHVA